MSNFNTFGTLSKPLLITGIILSLCGSCFVYFFNQSSWSALPGLKTSHSKLKKFNAVKPISFYKNHTVLDSLKTQQFIKWQLRQFNQNTDTTLILNDSVHHRILLMGDSEVGGFKFPLSRYCNYNGHKLVGVIEWNCATVFNYAYADTIEALISRFKPTYVFIVLGLNEVYARDISARTKAATIFKKKFEHLPFAWIGPASWIPDYGISDVYLNIAGSDNFFPSKLLNLPRASDNRHPNNRGYEIWMDSVAHWMNKRMQWKLQLNRPLSKTSSNGFSTIILNAAKYRGY